jgi:hypothetical protein
MAADEGPSLKEYLETRFNLLTTTIDKQQLATDLRYQQRFEAQSDALAAAFASQQAAMQTAFTVAEKAVQAALAAADRAVSKAELSADKRFEGVNEFRSTLADQQRTLIPRAEVDVLMRSLNEKIAALQSATIARQAESTGIKGGWGYAVGVFGFVMTVLSMVSFVLFYLARVKG